MATHPCRWLERISAYFDGEGSAWERWRCSCHARQCAACRAWLGQVESGWQQVRGALLGPRDAGFVDTVMRHVHATACAAPLSAVRPAPFSWAMLSTGAAAAALAVLVPVLNQSREASRALACQRTVQQIGQALSVYAGNHDDRLPPRDSWSQAAAGRTAKALRCPSDRSSPALASYSFMETLAGQELNRLPLATTPVVIEGTGGQFHPRHDRRGHVLFGDGSVRGVRAVPHLTGWSGEWQ